MMATRLWPQVNRDRQGAGTRATDDTSRWRAIWRAERVALSRERLAEVNRDRQGAGTRAPDDPRKVVHFGGRSVLRGHPLIYGRGSPQRRPR